MVKKATDCMSDENKYAHLRAINQITQFGLDMVTPIVLCTIAAVWAKNKFNIGNWIVIVAIILGIAASALNMLKFIKTVNKEVGGKNNDQERKD
ncbi:MAG: AtpZ/AtpI family protein [Clostridia bacterium]|nr:AtpZ/AtpI family protein [Clostridia bacterium]